MSFDHLTVARAGAVVTITISRPKVLNALNAATLDELRRAVLDVRHDETARVLVITGAGGRAFVAGADISELAEVDPVSARDLALRGQHVFDLIEHLGKPVIAAINGFALGGGCELALACTFRLASATAKLGQPEVKLGLIPGFAGTQRLSRLIGRDRALDLLLTGRQVDAEEALRLGLVTRVVPAAELADEVARFAEELAASPPIAVTHILDAVVRGADLPFAQAEALEATLFGLTAATADMREGTRAFLEKRPPRFQGR